MPRESLPLGVTEPVLRLRDALEWRQWLEVHHASESGAVLLISKKSTADGLHYVEALDEAVCFGWIDSKGRRHDAGHFTLRFSPRRADSVWSESNRARVRRLVRSKRMAPAGLAAVGAAKESGAWGDAYRVARTPTMPRDLRAALQENGMAWDRFREWAPTYRSACIRFVTDAKRQPTRLRRIARIVKAAANNIRPGAEEF